MTRSIGLALLSIIVLSALAAVITGEWRFLIISVLSYYVIRRA